VKISDIRLARRVARVVPPWLGGQLQRAPARLTFGLTGPFNGQQRRVEAVRSMFAAIPFGAVVETGTYRALTTRFLSRLTGAPIVTIEVNADYHDYARRRLAAFGSVYPLKGESPAVLTLLAADAAWTSVPTFFYLDAHWLDNLPLVDELLVIVSAWPEFVALIDDFRVEGDDGYGYDDYGPGKILELSLLSPPEPPEPPELTELAELRVFWPAASSRSETGARQGYVVLATPGTMADRLAELSELRAGGTLAQARH
jgi:hypothetical protein